MSAEAAWKLFSLTGDPEHYLSFKGLLEDGAERPPFTSFNRTAAKDFFKASDD